MTDEIDRAQDAAEAFRADALRRHQAKALRATPRGEKRRCEDCGELIPVARVAAVPAAVCCIDCQELRELVG